MLSRPPGAEEPWEVRMGELRKGRQRSARLLFVGILGLAVGLAVWALILFAR